MKLTINLTAAQRTKVLTYQRALEEEASELESSLKNVYDLRATISDLDKQRLDAAGKADRDTDAAARMLALDAQLQRLRPQVEKSEQTAMMSFGGIARAIGKIRQDLIQAEFGTALATAFRDHIEGVMAPYYFQRGFARQIAEHTNAYLVFHSVLRRRDPAITDVATAQTEIAAARAELHKILHGETFFDMNVASGS